MKQTSFTVVLADDHPMFRSGVRQAVIALDNFEIVAEVGDGESAVEMIKQYNPNYALLDLSMPKLNGFEILTVFNQSVSTINTKFLIISMHSSLAYAERARELGASAFIAKEDADTEVREALISTSPFFISRSIGNTFQHPVRPIIEPSENAQLQKLTTSERKVLLLVAEGKTTKEIARQLQISPRTVDAHRRNCADKLGISGRNGLIEFAVSHRDMFEPG